MNKAYVVIGFLSAVVWGPAAVCAILCCADSVWSEAIQWVVLAISAFVAGRIAGSILYRNMRNHVRAQKER